MSNQKRFCFILPNYIREFRGGSERQAYLIARELLKRGWEVHYVRENSQNLGKQETTDGIILHSLPRRHTRLKWSNTTKLLKLMKKIEADVWYCRGTFSYVYPVWKSAQKTGGKVIWACSHDAYVTKKMTKTIRKGSFPYRVALSIDKQLFSKAIKNIDAILLQSHDQRRMLHLNRGLDGQVIYNGHSLIPQKETEKEPIILWIGRLQPWKHPEKFAELARNLRDEHYTFVAIGRDMGHPRFVEELIKTEQEISSFKYLGELNQEDVFRWLERAKLLVNTSDYEGFSNTFIEAWWHSVPVITLKVNPDGLIQEHKLGYASSNPEKLATDVEMVMEDFDLWNQLSKNCRKFAEDHFDIREKVDELEKIISRLIEKEEPKNPS